MDALRKALNAHNVVLVVGSGVSASITGNQATSTWLGLVDSGRKFARTRNSNLGDDWDSLVQQALSYGEKHSDPSSLIQAAGMVSRALKNVSIQTFANWLNEDIGKLPVQNKNIAESLLAFPFPIMTTNYDSLLEQIGNRESAMWSDAKSIQAILSGDSNAIGHLHGVWKEPDSVVLSDSDYTNLVNAEDAQFLQRAMSGIKSIVYVGFGSGLGDPNFSSLLAWHRKTFPISTIKHFRLCLESEHPQLIEFHNADNIHPVIYGKDFADLQKFLESFLPDRNSMQLTQAGIARDVIGEVRQAWIEDLKADSIILEILRDDNLELSDLVLPPVLLPVPHSEYAKANSSKDRSNRIERLDPEGEIENANIILLVAEDGIGLTTAIRWLASKAALNMPSTVPFYVNFRQCRKGAKPLEEQIRKAAISHQGLMQERTSKLPPYVLALDDFNPSVGHISEKVIQSLSKNEAQLTIVGCKQGTEDDIIEKFKAANIQARVRYLGRLNEADVEELARFASPTAFEQLAESVVTVLRSENLPRSPFTVSLLIAIIIRGGKVASNASQTAILEQYVSDLLGRGDPHEDARINIDQANREVLLASLAQYFVDTSSSGLTEEEIIKFFASVFKLLGWTEKPTAILRNFLELRVLRDTGQYITFSQSSYLYLFAAKRARTHQDFLETLTQQPLYYAPVLKAYSALTRHDDDLLLRVSRLLEDLPDENLDGGTSFEELALVEAPGQIESTTSETEEDLIKQEDDDQIPDQHSLIEYSLLDNLEDDLPVFPGDQDNDIPFSLRLFRILDLVSTILRDSDQIEDLGLKRRVLIKTLGGWGRLITALNSDRTFQELMLELSSQFVTDFLAAEEEALEPEERQELVAEFMKGIPPSFALGGISTTLASRKLLTVFKEAVLNGELNDTAERAMAAAFFCSST